MGNVLKNSLIQCPYCGEQMNILVDDSAGSQHYIEDCQVCCAPIEISLKMDVTGEILEIQAHTDSD